ncbi:YdeI/OmpD-associated family protein [Hymenobacter sp. 102]|uniref:YdeI/OmpD-associated family protein n=1 Tax=Hymenobacter sp. 102 TaxID=3403152 RepID=UPI003CF590A6
MARKLDTLPVVDAPTRAEWRAWLSTHHTRPDGIWLTLYKKAKGPGYLSYAEAVEEALCFGWIDSVPRKVDAECYQLYFSPRKPGSVWSGLNKRRIAVLQAAGQLHPAGLAKIEAARQDGSWAVLDAVDALELPPDLAAAFAADAAAYQHFQAFPPSTRKAILQQLTAVKRPETRRQRIARIVEKAARNERAV